MPQHKGGKKGKGRKSARNKASGKYAKQKTRTTLNKAKAYKEHLARFPNDKENAARFKEKGVTR